METEIAQQVASQPQLAQLGAVAVIFIFAVKEFFAYLKTKKTTENSNNDAPLKEILAELQKMNSNHLHTLQETMEDGNRRLVETITNGNIKMIELLGEIKGGLNSRK